MKNNEVKKMVLGAVVAICVCTLMFAGFTQAAKSVVYKGKETVSTSYSTASITSSVNPDVPEDYVKSNYKVKFVDIDGKPTEKDMTMEEAAELGAQNLWRLYSASLENQTIYMHYLPAEDSQSRSHWNGEVSINDVLRYSFELDAITGEYYMTSRWDDSSEQVEPLEYLKDYQEFLSLAKATASKYQLVSGNVISSEYMGQRTAGKYLVIDILVSSDNGREAELTFETHSKKLVYVDYNASVKHAKANFEKSDQEAAQKHDWKLDEDTSNAN